MASDQFELRSPVAAKQVGTHTDIGQLIQSCGGGWSITPAHAPGRNIKITGRGGEQTAREGQWVVKLGDRFVIFDDEVFNEIFKQAQRSV